MDGKGDFEAMPNKNLYEMEKYYEKENNGNACGIKHDCSFSRLRKRI